MQKKIETAVTDGRGYDPINRKITNFVGLVRDGFENDFMVNEGRRLDEALYAIETRGKSPDEVFKYQAQVLFDKAIKGLDYDPNKKLAFIDKTFVKKDNPSYTQLKDIEPIEYLFYDIEPLNEINPPLLQETRATDRLAELNALGSDPRFRNPEPRAQATLRRYFIKLSETPNPNFDIPEERPSLDVEELLRDADNQRKLDEKFAKNYLILLKILSDEE